MTAIAPAIAAVAIAGATQVRPTEPFRQEHVEIRTHLDHVATWTGELARQAPAEQQRTMTKVINFFKEHIAPHAEWEEAKLYPAVDKRASKGEPFTASMRYEHRIVGRWIGELEALSARKNVTAFTARAHNLLGLITAHFEEEEEVLLPILDRSMTPEEFAKEIGGGHG